MSALAPRRRRIGVPLALAAAAVAAALGAGWLAWRALAEPQPLPADPSAGVPEHQRSGPLANPWGSGPAVLGSERAAEPPAAAVAATAARAGAAPAREHTASALAAPGAREALRAALAQLRAQGLAAEFVRRALADGDAAALVAAWMAERQCRQAAQWRLISQWRQRAAAGGGIGPGAGVPATGGSAFSEAQCRGMPEPEAVEGALKAAGFTAPAEAGHLELTRRPIELTLALDAGDPLLVAEVLEATAPDAVRQQLQAAPWKLDPRDLQDPDIVRAAVWLASCAPLRAGAPLQAACRDHPAFWQACMHQGLCDARDLRDLIVRSMPAGAAGTVELLARSLEGRLRAR
ncbi:MAG: hypothetical protein JNL85_19340, partial [Rubrivivax sp.]|nr:hypothetical protein [Rubrivivax sp.]